MDNIIQFPQGEQRTLFKRKIVLSKWQTLFAKTLYFFIKAIRGLWFYSRITIASTLHTSIVAIFSILHAFLGFIFFVSSIGCIITYFHLGKHFIAPGNYTIPFLITLWVMGCIGKEASSMLNNSIPFHRLLAVTKQQQVTTNKLSFPDSFNNHR